MIKKILIFSGDHPRHLYINSTFLKFKDLEFKGIVMKRESMIPKIDKKNSYLDNKNLKKHFLTRNNHEKKNFGNLNYKKIFKDIDYVECTSKTLNSKKIYNFIKKFNPDFVFIFGVDIIKEPILNLIDNKNLNLHLGLSPWYKGSATLFWPFYFLQPNYAGATFHQITKGIDDGPILHHSVPRLAKNEGIHDVSINVVKKAKTDLKKIIIKIINRKRLKLIKQKNYGKVFFTNSFKPYHLRVIYNLFNNNIVDFFLKTNVEKKKIRLIKFV